MLRSEKVPQRVSEKFDLAVEMTGNAVETLLPAAGLLDNPRTDLLTGQLASSEAAVMPLTAMVSILADARNKAKRDHEGLVRIIRTEAKNSKYHINAKRYSAFFRHRGVLRSISDIVKEANESKGSRSDTLNQLRRLSKEERKGKEVSPSSGPCQEEIQTVKWEIALEAKELKLQRLPSLTAENASLRTKKSCFRSFFETLGQVQKDVYDSMAKPKNFWAGAEALEKQNIELTSKIREEEVLATKKLVQLKSLVENFVSVKSKMAASRLESMNTRRCAHSVVNGAGEVEADIKNALMMISGEVTDATK